MARCIFIPATALILPTILLSVSLCYGQDPWPHFYLDDPILEDKDDFSIPEPTEIELSQFYDFVENTFFHPAGEEQVSARNVNTIDEVPNSSWFTNRHGTKRMSYTELARGSNKGFGPDTTQPLTVIRGKTEGVTPGFVIEDSREETYYIKFDPQGNLEMATSAEAIATRFFYALGYSVPENYLLDIHVSALRVSEKSTFRDTHGKKRRMTDEDLAWILDKAIIKPDSTIRVIASKAIEGKSLGHFRYYGTRQDDANDVIPHQHRRELRGLKLFAAWLNHDDTRSINSLDVYTGDGYIKHYLIDFGSCLGSGSVKMQTRRAGNEYMWESGPTFKTMATLGMWVRPYLRISYPDYPSVGRFESRDFRPELWRPEYPNPAFDLIEAADAFWAAKIIMRFTDDDIRVIVNTGMLGDGEAEEYLIRTLIERRDKIGSHYLNLMNPCDSFSIAGSTLYFSNLSVDNGFGNPPGGYTTSWWLYDNLASGPTEKLEGPVIHPDTFVELPGVLEEYPAGTYCFVEISPTDDAPESWQQPARVFLRKGENGMKIVGVYRKPG